MPPIPGPMLPLVDQPALPGRACAGCTLCCKLLSIAVLDKPRLAWCVHCAPGSGCTIYDRRPEICRSFRCGWLADAGIGEHWQPAKSKMVISYESADRIAIHTDPGRADGWRREPYYSDIKRWAHAAAARRGQIILWQGREVIAVLPDREINLGALRPDQLIVTVEVPGPSGPVLDIEIYEADGG
jgi:hypothetical protein